MLADEYLARKSQFHSEIAISLIASMLFLVFNRLMMDPLGKRVLRYAVICSFILWAVLVCLLVLAVR